MKDNYDRLAQEAAEFGCSILIREREDNSDKVNLYQQRLLKIFFSIFVKSQMLIYRSYGDRGKSQIYNFNLVLEIKNLKIFSVASHITIFYHRESRQH